MNYGSTGRNRQRDEMPPWQISMHSHAWNPGSESDRRFTIPQAVAGERNADHEKAQFARDMVYFDVLGER